MPSRIQNSLIVLAVAALLCGAVVGFDVRRSRSTSRDEQKTFESESATPNGFTARDAAASKSPATAATEMSTPRSSSGTARLRDAADNRSPTSVERFQDWMNRYLETEPDLGQLRRDLEQALARLPADESAAQFEDADAAMEALRRAEQTAGADYRSLMEQAEQFLEVYPHSPLADEAKSLFAKYARAWDESEFQEAAEFSRANPTTFDGRLSRYQSYVEHHGAAGRFVSEARAAIEAIRTQWAEHDYRQIHDFATHYPSDLSAVAQRVRRFLDQHAETRHRAAAELFLARFENAATPREYRVRVKSGSFARSIGRSLSSGPDLAVEIEVGGVRLGRTPVVADSFQPVWDYEFPQRVRWRLGDAVRIRVIDFDYSNRVILKIEPPPDEPLGLRFLSGTIHADGHQLTFDSDFEVPTLPPPP